MPTTESIEPTTEAPRDWGRFTVTEHFETLRAEKDPEGQELWTVDVHPMQDGRPGPRMIREQLGEFDEQKLYERLIPGTYQVRLRRGGVPGHTAQRNIVIDGGIKNALSGGSAEPAAAAPATAAPAPATPPVGGDVMAAMVSAMFTGMQQQAQSQQALMQVLLTKLLEKDKPESRDVFSDLVKLDEMLDRRADRRDGAGGSEALTSIAQSLSAAMARAGAAAPPAKAQKPAAAKQAAPAKPAAPEDAGVRMVRSVGAVMVAFGSNGTGQDAIEGAADAVLSLLDSGGYSPESFVGSLPETLDPAVLADAMPGADPVFVNAVLNEIREQIEGADDETGGEDTGPYRLGDRGDTGGSGDGDSQPRSADPDEAG